MPPQNGPEQVEGLGDGLTSGDGDVEGVGLALGSTLGEAEGDAVTEGDTLGDGSTVGDALGDGSTVGDAEGVGDGVTTTIGQNGAGSNVKPFPESVMLFHATTEPWIRPLPEIWAVPRGAMNVP